MSRTTNSLLLRYNINIFWSSSLNKKIGLTNSLSLEFFFDLFLQNYFFKPLKIEYTNNNIIIYIYYLKMDRFSFLFKYLKLKKNY